MSRTRSGHFQSARIKPRTSTPSARRTRKSSCRSPRSAEGPSSSVTGTAVDDLAGPTAARHAGRVQSSVILGSRSAYSASVGFHLLRSLARLSSTMRRAFWVGDSPVRRTKTGRVPSVVTTQGLAVPGLRRGFMQAVADEDRPRLVDDPRPRGPDAVERGRDDVDAAGRVRPGIVRERGQGVEGHHLDPWRASSTRFSPCSRPSRRSRQPDVASQAKAHRRVLPSEAPFRIDPAAASRGRGGGHAAVIIREITLRRGRLEGAGNARAKMARCPDGRQRRDRAFHTKRAKNSKELLVVCESRRRPIIPV